MGGTIRQDWPSVTGCNRALLCSTFHIRFKSTLSFDILPAIPCSAFFERVSDLMRSHRDKIERLLAGGGGNILVGRLQGRAGSAALFCDISCEFVLYIISAKMLGVMADQKYLQSCTLYNSTSLD